MVSAALARARKLACAAAEASIVKGMIVFTGADGWHTVRTMKAAPGRAAMTKLAKTSHSALSTPRVCLPSAR